MSRQPDRSIGRWVARSMGRSAGLRQLSAEAATIIASPFEGRLNTCCALARWLPASINHATGCKLVAPFGGAELACRRGPYWKWSAPESSTSVPDDWSLGNHHRTINRWLVVGGGRSLAHSPFPLSNDQFSRPPVRARDHHLGRSGWLAEMSTI